MDTVCYEFLESHGFVIITQHQLVPRPCRTAIPDGSWWGLEKKRMMRRLRRPDAGPGGDRGRRQPRLRCSPRRAERSELTPRIRSRGDRLPDRPETRQLYDEARRISADLCGAWAANLLDLTLNTSPTYDGDRLLRPPARHRADGDTPELGVVDADGEVLGHPGLYVVDGAAVPTALGVNPSLTIAALAERAAVRLVRRLGQKPAAPPLSNPYVRRRRRETGPGLR